MIIFVIMIILYLLYLFLFSRGRGAVVIISSGACSQITPQMTVYAGTKVENKILTSEVDHTSLHFTNEPLVLGC